MRLASRRQIYRTLKVTFLFLPLILAFQNCGAPSASKNLGTSANSANGTPNSPAPSPNPSPSPSPNPSPTPMPSPTPTPTPSPNPSPTPNPSPSPSPSPGGSSWKTLKVGAGGFIRGIAVAPDGTLVNRTDTYGAYIWSGSQWQQLVTANSLPASFVNANINTENLGQGVYEVQVAPSNTQILYMSYAGYVFKSTNRGMNWTQTTMPQFTQNPNDGYAQNGQKMAIDPNNSNIAYVGTPQLGLYVTKDGGATFSKVSQVPVGLTDSKNGNQYPGFTGILFAPGASAGVVNGTTQTIFAYSFGNGVYMSKDAGATWSLLANGPSNVINAAVSSNGYYYATEGTNLWIYKNNAWTELTSTQIADGYNIQAIAVDPKNSNTIVLIASAGYLDVSLDGGTTWTGIIWTSNNVASSDIPWLKAANESTSGNYLDIGGAVFNPLVPNQVIVSAGTGVWNFIIPASISASSSITFNDMSLGIEQLVANTIISPPGGNPILASWDRPFFTISNPSAYPLTYGPVASVHIDAGWSVDYAASNPSFIAGLTSQGHGVYSNDGGKTWMDFASQPGFPGQANGGSIAVSTPNNIILAPADGVQPYYTLDGGKTWTGINLPGVTTWNSFIGAYYLDVRAVTADRVAPNTFYLLYGGLYKSRDGGVTWTQVFKGDITPFAWYNNELMSVPGQSGHLFFTGGWQGAQTQPAQESFVRSMDGGATWTPVPNVLNVTSFGFGKAAPGQTYPAIYIVGWVNNVYGIYQSIDNAQTWTALGAYPLGSVDTIKTIAGDSNTFGVVYVGFSGSGYAYYGP